MISELFVKYQFGAIHSGYGPFLLKLPYYHQNMTLVLDIFCFYKFYICLHDNGQVYYLNQGHFVTELNNGFLISGRTFYPQKFITVTMENVTAEIVQQIETYSKYHCQIHIHY